MVDWRRLGREALRIAGSPSFVFSERTARVALSTLQAIDSTLPMRHWLSLKTQPVARLVGAAPVWGLGVEVVSEYELLGALASGVRPSRILVNGVGKQHWLRSHLTPELCVHFDSLAEVRQLARSARELGWRIGLRCAIPHMGGAAGVEAQWDQFGMAPEEVRVAAQLLGDAGVGVDGLHFHLHTNVERASEYRGALECLRETSELAGLEPRYIDLGGGLPIPGDQPLDAPSAASTFDLAEFQQVLRSIPLLFPSVRELWLENGRFLTGAAGALVVTVLDRKERGGRIYLICDGGRTNHARLAATEAHDIILEPNRGGPEREAVVCGPTCGAVDRLGCWMLPESVAPGDMLIWLNAGAYHIPLETRFSFGLAPVVWFDENEEPAVVRERETPEQWWSQWTPSGRPADAAAR
jgi:diaminopimelate decarboxylase